MSYRTDPVFHEPHTGPLVADKFPHHGNDPSRRQIAAMCELIRKHAPRLPVGACEPWTVPTWQ